MSAPYVKRYAGGFVDGSGGGTPEDSQFLNGLEDALLRLLGAVPAVDTVPVWAAAGGGAFVFQKITNAQIDPAAAIAKSKLAPLAITDADIAAGAAIAKSKLASLGILDADVAAGAAIAYAKLALAGSVVNADIAAAAAIALSKLAGYPADGTKFAAGDGTWKVGSIAPTHLPGMGSIAFNTPVVANQAYLVPIGNVTVATTITRIIWSLTTVVAGNYDVGIYYSDDEATFTRLGSLGSTAQPAAGQIISVLSAQTITPVAARRWYYGIALSTASTIGMTGVTLATGTGIPGYFKVNSFPLPASLTGMTAIGAVPLPALHGAI